MHSRRTSITGRFLPPSRKGTWPRRGIFLAAIGIAILSAAAAGATLVTPDAAFWGSVAIGGSPAPAGTVLSGQVEGVELAVHVLGSNSGAPQMYRLRVPLSQAAFFYDAPLPGTGFPGQSVQIFVDGHLVAEEVLEAGELTRLDLNDTGSPPPTFTATPPRPTPTITPTRPVATATRTRVPSPTGALPTVTGVVAGTPTKTSNASPTPTPTGPTATPTGTVTGSQTATPTGSPVVATPTPTPTGGASCIFPCTGDCNGDCRVTINEMILSANLSLSGNSLAECLAADPDRDGRITIAELIAAVNRALNGCPAQSP